MATPTPPANERPSAALRSGPPGGRGNKPSFRQATEVFRYRNYRFLWISSSFSFTGMQMHQIVRALLAWHLTGSYSAVGLVMLSFGLPMFLFSLIGGSLADRFEKRNLTLMTQSATGTLALITAVLILADVITIQMLVAIGLVQGTFFAFGMPARTPLMAEVVGPNNVMAAIAMSNASMNATRLVGPALAAVLVGVFGFATAYFAQSFFYVLSVATLLMVPTGLSAAARNGREAPERGNVFAEIGKGLRYVAGHPRLRLLIAMMFIMSFFAMPFMVLLPGFIQEDLGQSESAYGWLQATSGAGALVASLSVATLTTFDRKPLLQWFAGILAATGLFMLSFASIPLEFIGAILGVVVLGVATTAYQTLNNTMVMDASDPEYYGRVMSLNMLTFSVMPIMGFPLGAVADAIGARETFAIQGAIVALMMAFVAIANAKYTFGKTHEHRQPEVVDGGRSPVGAPPTAAPSGGD